MSNQYQNLTSQIKAGKVILILGQAYLSFINRQRDDFVEPLLKELNVNIKTTEPKHLPGIYQLLIDRGYEEARIHRAIQTASESIIISDELRLLVQVPWRTIFFSGIDEILSRAIQKYVPKRSLRTVYDRDTKFSDIKNPSYYHMIWLEGCVNQDNPIMWPAVTDEQKKRRRPAMKSLLGKIEDFAGLDCKVVIAGFNFSAEDPRLKSTLFEIIEDNLPLGSTYLFPLQDCEIPYEFKGLEAEGTMDIIEEWSFIEFLKTLPKDVTVGSSKRSELRINTAHGTEELSERELRLFRGNIIPLTEEVLQAPPIPIDDDQNRYYEFREFLIGKPWPNWQHLASGFVYERKDYDVWLQEILGRMSGQGKSTQNSVFALSGPSGTGKTVALQYLAWMTAKNSYPVIFIPQIRHNPDYEIIRRFCEAVQPKERTKSGASSMERVLIAWDSLAANSKSYTALSSWLQSKGLPSLIVGTIYNKETINSQLPMDEEDIQYNIKTFEVSPKFTDDESQEFTKFLESIAPEITERIPNISKFIESLKEDIFLAMFDFLPETRRSRTEGVIKEINNYQEFISDRFKSIFSDPKGKKWKKLLRLAAVSTQYNCIPSLDLILRALGSNAYNEWWQDKQHEKFNGIIKEYEDAGVPYLGMRNSRIAQIAVKNILTIDEQLTSVKQLLLSCRLSTDEEREFVHKWVLAMRNPADERTTKSLESIRREDMISIYEGFINKQGDDPLVLHQLARLQRRYAGENLTTDSLETQEQYFNKALGNFEKALAIIEQEDPLHRSRERQNIINSIASVYRDIVKARLIHIKNLPTENRTTIQALEKKNQSDFVSIQSYCSQGRLGNRPSPYPYDVEVTSLMNFYQNDLSVQNDPEKKSNLISDMLVLLDQAETNFVFEDIETLLTTRVQVENFMDKDFQLKTIKKLEEKGNLNGYYIRARQLAYKRDRRNLITPTSAQGVNQAYKLLTEELDEKKLVNSKKCLSLLERLWWTKHVEFSTGKQYNSQRIGYDLGIAVALTVEKWKEYHKILETLSMAERSAGVTNLHLRFMMAWSSFQIGKYKESLSYFRDLDRVSQGSVLRTKKLAKVSNEVGAVAIFTGEVAELRDISHGMAYFPRLNIRLPFNPKTFAKYPKIHDTEDFEIHLNYRLPLAMPASK